MGEAGDTDTYIKVGPVGSRNGADWDEKGHNNIVQIFVSHDDGINSLKFQYLESGTLVLSDTHGSNEGFQFDVAKLVYPTEHITWIGGYRSSNSGHVCSLTFGTNTGQHGPYGKFTDKDKAFRFSVGEGRQFAGFYGTADDHLVKSVGIYIKPVTSIDYLEEVTGAVAGFTVEHVGKWEVLNGEKQSDDSIIS